MSKLKIDITGLMDDHYKKGVELVEIDQIEQAIVEFKKSVEVTKRKYLSYWALGKCYNQIGKYKDAVTFFNRVLQDIPGSVDTFEIYYFKAFALKKLGKYEEAILDLKEVVKQDPTNADAWNLKSNCHRAMGNYEEAIKSLDKALEVNPKNLLARKNKAALLIIQGKSEDAQAVLDEILKIEPIDFQSWIIKGEKLTEIGNFGYALKCFNEAVKVGSGHPYAYQMLQKCKQRQKQYQDIRNSSPHYSNGWNARGIKLHSIGVYLEALECFEEALKSEPVNYDYLMNKALVLKDLGRYNKTLDIIESLLREYPNDAILWNNKGMMFYMLEQYDNGYWSFEKALKLDPNLSEAQINKERMRKLQFQRGEKKVIDEQTVLKNAFERSLCNYLETQGSAFTIRALKKRLDSFIEDPREIKFGRENLEQTLDKLKTQGRINSTQHNGEWYYLTS